MGLKVHAEISRLRPDRVSVKTIDQAHRLCAAVIAQNPDRDVRVSIVRDGKTIFAKDHKVSVPRTCQGHFSH